MSVTLNPVLQALGYRGEMQQRDFIKLLAASGAFGDLPNVEGTLTDKQAQAILASVRFENAEEAANWLHYVTQEYMLRPSGSERYQCNEPDYFKQNRGELLNALHHIGALAEIRPKEKHYDHVLVLGAIESAVSTRLDMVRELYDQGVRFDKIHLLASDRPLDPELEPLAKVATDVGSVATEMQMMIARTYEKNETWPEALQNVRTFYVDTFNHSDGRRANTQDNARSWLNWLKESKTPLKGNVLVISNQPNVAYQDAAMKSILPKEFAVETVGARIGEDGLKISVAMDAIARQIDVSFPKLLETLKTQKPEIQPEFRLIDPASIESDPAMYQFRFNADGKNGETREHAFTAEHWDPILHGDPLLVHERRDGTLFVADGHHRLALAKRLATTGQGPEKLAAQVLREADGYTAQDVKIIAAYKNLAQGHTKAAEAALVFKEAESGTVNKDLLPKLDMKKGNLELSYSLSKLSRPSLDMVASGDVPEGIAAEVAKRVSDPKRQDSVMQIISGKLHQNYDNYVAQDILADNYKMNVQTQTISFNAPPAPRTAPEGNAPGFLAKLQQQRAQAAAGTGTVIRLQ